MRFLPPVRDLINLEIREKEEAARESAKQQKYMQDAKEYHVKARRTDSFGFTLDHWKGIERLNPIQSYLIDRIYREEPRRNGVLSFAGETGSGKSYAALTLGYLSDDQFDAESVVFSLEEFKTQISEGKKAILLDDLEVFAGSRESMTRKNKSIAKIFQSVRFKRHLLLITTPSLGYLDVILRELLHVEAYTAGLNLKSKMNILRVFFRQQDPRTGRIYRHSPIIWNDEEKIWKKQSVWHIRKPPDALIRAYEKRKEEIFDQWMEEPVNNADKNTANGDNHTPKKYEVVSKLLEKGLSAQEIAEVLGVKTNNIQRLISYIRHKRESGVTR
ncbi:MAG: hypothetical protein MASP_01806 [Candidatus Methanolliviera sp. GoM_asphalt]|nr:MAG: hypothetical protein MASP_01806 [Candidatus Methanolliviera sp. GoM_asphalt]